MKNIIRTTALATILLIGNSIVFGQCATNANVYSFVYDGKTYEVIKENKTWIDAAACASERGGILIEINDAAEQNAVYAAINSNASITASNTLAPDGGGGAYVWIGGNDLAVEGNWMWDGANDSSGTQFWMGTSSGTAVGGLYNNWGNEPDDFGGQDALALSLNGWPLGIASQWNDVDHTNSLYYVVEYPNIVSIEELDLNNRLALYPNPVSDILTIEAEGIALSDLMIINSMGQEIMSSSLEQNSNSQTVDLSSLEEGVYYLKIQTQAGESILKKVIK